MCISHAVPVQLSYPTTPSIAPVRGSSLPSALIWDVGNSSSRLHNHQISSDWLRYSRRIRSAHIPKGIDHVHGVLPALLHHLRRG